MTHLRNHREAYAAATPLPDRTYLDRLRDRLLLPPTTMTESELLRLHRDAVGMLNTFATALASQPVPPILFDGPAVFDALSRGARTRTGAANVADTLDAVVRLMRGTTVAPSGEQG